MKRSALIGIIPFFCSCAFLYGESAAYSVRNAARVQQMRSSVKHNRLKKYDSIVHQAKKSQKEKNALAKKRAEKQHDEVLDMAHDGHFIHLAYAAQKS